MPTQVKFRYHKGNKDLYAFFPRLKYDDKGFYKTSYSHIGQHSACHVEYEKESRPATPEEYASLKEELESIGYELKICK